MEAFPNHHPRICSFLLIITLFPAIILPAHAEPHPIDQENTMSSISSNPAAINITTGTGELQKYIEKQLDIEPNQGIRVGGAWIADTNYLFSGGIEDPQTWTSNSLFLLGLTADTQKLFGWNGGLFGLEFLQFNGQNTNGQAGTVQGYNSLPGHPPLNRSELYQLWYRQTLFDEKFNVRIGKTVPTFDFNNVLRPVYIDQSNLSIPAVSGLIYTPIFVNSSLLGVLPGYYNSAYGITVNFMPVKKWYFSFGAYDGNGADGEQTGIKVGPTLNGSYFYIGETGIDWLLGAEKKPGNIGIGAWHQDGPIAGPPTISEDAATGFYLFGSQRLWYKNAGVDNSGISFFYQYGINDSEALPMNQYVGAGLTAFGLVSHRPADSMGIGLAYSWLNEQEFHRDTELMLQTYYQAKIVNGLYLEPALSYIPTPGASNDAHAAWAGTLRAIVLF